MPLNPGRDSSRFWWSYNQPLCGPTMWGGEKKDMIFPEEIRAVPAVVLRRSEINEDVSTGLPCFRAAVWRWQGRNSCPRAKTERKWGARHPFCVDCHCTCARKKNVPAHKKNHVLGTKSNQRCRCHGSSAHAPPSTSPAHSHEAARIRAGKRPLAEGLATRTRSSTQTQGRPPLPPQLRRKVGEAKRDPIPVRASSREELRKNHEARQARASVWWSERCVRR